MEKVKLSLSQKIELKRQQTNSRQMLSPSGLSNYSNIDIQMQTV
jgi:hypothetical protein